MAKSCSSVGRAVVRTLFVAVSPVLLKRECLHYCIALVLKGNVVLDLEDVNHESDCFITIMGSIYDTIQIAIRFMGGWHGANHWKLAVRHLVR